MCKGIATTLTASGASSYSWNTNSVADQITVNPTANSTVYTVTGKDMNGCTNTASHTLNVYQNPVVTISGPGQSCTNKPFTMTASGADTYLWSTGGAAAMETVYGSDIKTYSVTGTTINGCSGNATYSVSLLPALSIYSFLQDAICVGNEVELLAVGSDIVSNSWNNGVPTSSAYQSFVHTVKTTYTLRSIDINGCVNTATKEIDIYPLPLITVTTNHENICLGDNIQLEVFSNGSWFNWSSTDVEFNKLDNYDKSVINYSPKATNIYIVRSENGYRCRNSDSVKVIVENCTPTTIISTNSLDEFSYKVYPNPTIGKFTIQTPSIGEEIIIADVTGNTIKRIVSYGINSVDISDLSNGMYYVTILKDGNSIVFKVMKQ